MTLATLSSIPTRTVALASDQFEALRSPLADQFLTADSADLDEARKTLYITVDRYLLAQVRAANAEDVAAAMAHSPRYRLPRSWQGLRYRAPPHRSHHA